MSAIFGIEERNACGFIGNSVMCIPRTMQGKPDVHAVVSAIKSDDLVFIQHCVPQSCLQIKAVGIVRSDFPKDSRGDFCVPVEWVWRGEKLLESFDEALLFCGNALYEEHDILVQREILNLLPERYQMPQEW